MLSFYLFGIWVDDEQGRGPKCHRARYHEGTDGSSMQGVFIFKTENLASFWLAACVLSFRVDFYLCVIFDDVEYLVPSSNEENQRKEKRISCFRKGRL